jgi:hypothetical protein
MPQVLHDGAAGLEEPISGPRGEPEESTQVQGMATRLRPARAGVVFDATSSDDGGGVIQARQVFLDREETGGASEWVSLRPLLFSASGRLFS